MMSLAAATASTKATEAVTPKVKVGLFLDKGCFGNGPFCWARILNNSPQLELSLLDGKDIKYGKLNDLQLLVCPGGGGSRQIDSMEPIGFDRVQKFVEDGGCYLGICAGSYNAMNRPGRFKFLPYDYVDNANGRQGDLLVEITNEGAKLLDHISWITMAVMSCGRRHRPAKATAKFLLFSKVVSVNMAGLHTISWTRRP